MCYMRDQITNKNIFHEDQRLKASQLDKRLQSHNKVPPVKLKYDLGESVMIKDQVSKTKPREKFIVVDPNVNDTHVKIQKQNHKFMSRQYDIPKHQLIRLPRKAAVKARQRISDTAQLCMSTTKTDEVPLHAFDNSLDSDEEDNVFYTYECTTDNLCSNSPTNSSYSIASEHSEWVDDTDEHFLSPTESENNSASSLDTDQHSREFHRLASLIDDTRQFLTIHPKPPSIPSTQALPRRSQRIRKQPARYEY